MDLLKPLVRAATGSLSVFAAFWGILVTDDLVWLFVAIGIIGVLNFLIGMHDERRIRAADNAVAADRAILRELQEHTRGLVGPMAIPAHLQNLSALSHSQIKGLVEQISPAMREFSKRTNEEAREETYRSIEQGLEFWGRSSAASAISDRHHAEFHQKYRSDAVALWEELKRRVPDAPQPEYAPSALECGMLAGVYPVEAAVDELERLARLLPDDRRL